MQDEGEASFKDVFDQICYDWGFDKKNLYQDEKGNFVINKTYITPEEMTYKVWKHKLKPGVFEKLLKLKELLDE